MAGEVVNQPYISKVPELRKKFLDKHYSSDKNYYDSRDISRVKSDDFFLVQFLNCKDGNVDKAHKTMVEALKWRKSFGINDLTENDIPEEVWRSKVCYFYGRDKKGTRLMLSKLIRYTFKDNKELTMGYRKLVALSYEKHQREYPGEKLTFVNSCEGVSLSQADMDTNSFVIKLLTVCYPDIMENTYVLHYTKLFESLWKISKVLLGSKVASKYVFTSPEDILQYIDKDQLPLEFGGPSFVYNYPPEEKTDKNDNNQEEIETT